MYTDKLNGEELDNFEKVCRIMIGIIMIIVGGISFFVAGCIAFDVAFAFVSHILGDIMVAITIAIIIMVCMSFAVVFISLILVRLELYAKKLLKGEK